MPKKTHPSETPGNDAFEFATCSWETIRELLGEADETRLSIYLPTHPTGPEAEADRSTLRICLKDARAQLLAYGRSDDEADAFLKPVRLRLDDPDLWKNLASGLAILATSDRQVWIRSDDSFDRQVSLGPRFRLAPLVLGLPHTERYCVLALSLNEVRLVDVRPETVEQVRPKGLPKSMDDVLGLDQFDTGLHVHSAGPRTLGRGSRIVHGHGADDEERRRTSDLRTYLRAVADAVHDTVGDRPLILAAVAEYFPIFRGVYAGKDLITGIHGNPESLSDVELADSARSLVRRRDADQRAELLEQYRELPDRRRAAENPRAILVAAAQGRVETLFVEKGSALWGSFEPDRERTEIHDGREPGDEDLLDVAVSQTLLHGGDVIAVTAAENPSPGPLAAILRFRGARKAA